jgi:antitoxin ParD1/3/4
MPKVVKRTFSLTQEQAKFIDERVESGEYASGSEVVREGIRAMQEDNAAIERWLRKEVLPAIERVKSGKAKTHTPEEVRRHIEERYRQLLKAAE